MKRQLLAFSLVAISSAMVRSETCFVDGCFVPDPNHAIFLVTMTFFDVRDSNHPFAVSTKNVNGSTPFSEPITPPQAAEQIKVTFATDLSGFDIVPPDVTIRIGARMHARRVAWLPSTKKRDAVYLANFKQAEILLKESNDPSQAVIYADYASALAKTGNQKVEAAKLEAKAHLANNRPDEALQVFTDTAQEPNFEKADKNKKKAFVGEWFDTVETAAKSEGATPDNQTGVLFTSVPANSKVPEQFNNLTKALAKVDPKFGAKATRLVPKQSAVLGSDLAGTENFVRGELSRHPYKSSQ